MGTNNDVHRSTALTLEKSAISELASFTEEFLFLIRDERRSVAENLLNFLKEHQGHAKVLIVAVGT